MVVIATPCPLLLAIPTAIIGAISLAARRAIIIKNPAVLEQIEKCRTLIFDKTGTLTYGRPKLTEVLCAEGFRAQAGAAACGQRGAIFQTPAGQRHCFGGESQEIAVLPVEQISERPGEGLRGSVAGHTVQITGRKR